MFMNWVGGSQNVPKPAYVIYEWYLELHLHPHWQSCPSLSFPIECPAVLWEIRWENINSEYILYFHGIETKAMKLHSLDWDKVITTNWGFYLCKIPLDGSNRFWHINHWTWAIILTGERGPPGQIVTMQNNARWL